MYRVYLPQAATVFANKKFTKIKKMRKSLDLIEKSKAGPSAGLLILKF